MADSRSFNQQGEWGSMSGEKSGSAEWEKVYEALKYAEGVAVTISGGGVYFGFFTSTIWSHGLG